MKFRKLLYTWLTVISLSLGWLFYKLEKIETNLQRMEFLSSNQDLPSVQTFMSIEKYSEQYNIPKHILHNIAFRETTYQGPFDWEYKFNRESSYGAVGPMQVTLIAAKDVYGHSVNKTKLRNNIEFNIKTSAAYLNKLHRRFGDWEKVVSYYSAYPKEADYVVYVLNHKNYKSKWLRL